MSNKARSIDEFTDAELAKMVRESVYVTGTRFNEKCRFLLVLAVPYGLDDNVETLGEALDSFAELVQADDWTEREFQVYDHEACQHYFGATRECVEE